YEVTSSPRRTPSCPGSSKPAPSAPPPAGDCSAAWTWKPPGSPKDSTNAKRRERRKVTDVAQPRQAGSPQAQSAAEPYQGCRRRRPDLERLTSAEGLLRALP